MDETEREGVYLCLQVENILVSQKNEAKLCDFGSATTKVMNPSSAGEIAQAEEEIQVGGPASSVISPPCYSCPRDWLSPYFSSSPSFFVQLFCLAGHRASSSWSGAKLA